MTDILATQQNFRALSVKDLLQARDLYHYHLLNKPNVVGTAIGLYLIRKGGMSPTEERAFCQRTGTTQLIKGERTLQNSTVRDYSWPCVLAFVREWLSASDFGTDGKKYKPEEMIPRTLYMPDGRMVPVCVVKVKQGEPATDRLVDWHWPKSLFGGGMPIIVDAQKQTHQATAGCLVSDGHTTYALTSRHVCGNQGEPVSTLSRGEPVEIGRASARHLTRLPFTEVYPEFVGHRTYVNLDVGLIELTDLNQWTSQTFGLGPMGALADLNELNISTRLIDAPVVAYGAASGSLEGRIKALFYRYRSVGGYDYVADFLIGPRQSEGESPQLNQTQPGDSGAVWHLVTNQKTTATDEAADEDADFEGDLRPLAVEWGGQVFVENATRGSFAFALATSLTTVCSALDVELVTEHNTGVVPYWGQMGHYSIASFACEALPAGKLKDFMTANIDRISFGFANLNKKEIKARLKTAREKESLVPLADVPDEVWKKLPWKVTGGRDIKPSGFSSTGPEHPTHYADIDEHNPNETTLREQCLQDHNKIDVDYWRKFYTDHGHTEQHERGLLPFRVWQFFDAMKGFLTAGDPEQFLCAAGLLSHYVGDACQPLHGSIYADGDPETNKGQGVHSCYETSMIESKQGPLVAGLTVAIKAPGEELPQIQTGKDAALATIELMDRSARKIPPKEIVAVFVKQGGTDTADVREELWNSFGKGTIAVMTDGARVLAKIWEGAWNEGDGEEIPGDQLGPIDPDVLNGHSRNPDFVKSFDLDEIKNHLEGHP
jgi:hypothetical protein